MPWHLNQKGGCYRYGFTYPLQKRLQVIVTYLTTLSTANTAAICQVSYNCVDKFVEAFQQKATLTPAINNNARPKKIAWWMEAYLEALVVIYPTIYLRELLQLLAVDFNVAPRDIPSIATIARLMIELRLTRKKCVHVATERMSPYNLNCRQLFFQWRITVDPSHIYFFDESCFNSETDSREYGRTESGVACPSFRPKSQARIGKFSVLGVCGYIEGVVQVIPIAGNCTADIIMESIEHQILPLLPRNVFLVADNASVHNEQRLCAILRRKNITLVKLPAYGYDLNPIEMIFGQAKAIARSTPGFIRQNPLIAIINAFENISPLNVRKFYRRSWRISV